MSAFSVSKRFLIIRLYLIIGGILLLFWWPLSHWFYPQFYHSLLHFPEGSYPYAMVKVIGTCGILPVFLMITAGVNPQKSRTIILALALFSLLISLTYGYLILKGLFPMMEFINMGISFCTFLFLIAVYPWNSTLCKNL